MSTISHIPLDDPIITRAMTLIPQEYWGNTWIAGSAATRYPMNKDVDVWVCGVPGRVSIDKVVVGSRKLAELGTPINQDDNEYDHIAFKAYDQDNLQIMVSHDNINDILSHFDISSHCAAVNLVTGVPILGPGYEDKLKVVNFTNAVNTISRYLRFAERYQDWWGMEEEMTKRCAATAFNLYTYDDLKYEVKYLVLDKGL